ncbi:hypothetical protein RhiirC2_740747, partial [Rhizophagus irregularis]
MIILGNFNINLHKTNSILLTNNIDGNNNNKNYMTLVFYHKTLLTTLKTHTFKDIVKLYNETPSFTFKNSSNHTSYIDIIFVSPNLISHSICASIIEAPINTNHYLISLALNNKFFHSLNNNYTNRNH